MSVSVNRNAYRLTESSIMLAFAAVLSVLKIVDMPYGGSVTACSMLPLLIIAYRYGTRWGTLTAFAYALIQLLLGLDNLSYATSFGAAVAIIVCDYLLAFVVLGLGGLFRRNGWSQGVSLTAAAVATGLLRYLCHVIAGCTVWAGLSVPTAEAALYSFSYNATYMLPELVILALGALYISRFLSFDGASITRAAARRNAPPVVLALTIISKTVLFAALVWVVVLLAPSIQSVSDGTLFLAGLAAAPWGTVGIVIASGLGIFAVLEGSAAVISRRKTH